MPLLLWIGFSFAVGALAGKYGRSSLGWFFLALLISPLLAVIFLQIADKTLEQKAKDIILVERISERLHNGQPASPPKPRVQYPGKAVIGSVVVTIALGGLLIMASRSGTHAPSAAGPEWNRTQQPADMKVNTVEQREFTDGQLCQAAVATSVSIDPRQLILEAEAGSYARVSYIRAMDGRLFRSSCMVMTDRVHVSDPATGKLFQNISASALARPPGV